MLSSSEHKRIYQQAYVPEHLPDYVAAISGGEPYIFDDYLCYSQNNHLLFIGYPLVDNPAEISQVYQAACERLNPRTIMLVADDLSSLPEGNQTQPADRYYRLDLPLKFLSPEVAYMVRRAERELKIAVGQFGREHKRIIKDFIGRQNLSAEQIHIFKHVQHYLKRSKTAHLLEVRQADRLVAFSIVDMGSACYAFYQFNFRSAKIAVPGASDLQQAINLGLGIHTGIRRFKEKWGGDPFLAHHSVLIHRKPVGLGKLASKL
jgi:hypothetical protein